MRYTKLCISIAKSEFRKTTDRRGFYHWSFVFQKNDLIEWAQNRPGHATYTVRYGYQEGRHTLHAEVAAFCKAAGLIDRRFSWYMINIRLLVNGALALSKPCRLCQHFLAALNCSCCWYSTNEGTFEQIRFSRAINS